MLAHAVLGSGYLAHVLTKYVLSVQVIHPAVLFSLFTSLKVPLVPKNLRAENRLSFQTPQCKALNAA